MALQISGMKEEIKELKTEVAEIEEVKRELPDM